jgi:hypothetical protein
MIENLTATEYNNQLTVKGALAAETLAATMNELYRLFWARDTQVILDSMNANVALTIERFTANTELGTAVNTQLAKTDIETRVIVTMPEGYSFNGTQFIFTP